MNAKDKARIVERYDECLRLFAIAKRLTKRVCLRHDHPRFEFSLYLHPDFSGWRTAPRVPRREGRAAAWRG